MRDEFDEIDELMGVEPKRTRKSKRHPNKSGETERNAVRRRGRRNAKKNRKKDYLSIVLIAICAIVFIVAAFQLYKIFAEYNAGATEYSEITDLAITVPEIEKVEESEGYPYEQFYVDFDALSSQNSDVVAWIMFESPEIISYPVVQTDDNDTYLTTTFLGETNIVGAIFLDKSNDSDFTDDNTIIYGHNMKDNSMFGDLSVYVEEEFYEEYPYFYIYTPDGKASKYQVAAVEEIMATDLNRYTINFADDFSFQSYIDIMIQNSYYDTNAPLDTDSKLVTLSTCTGSDDRRFIVQGVKIEERDMVVAE